MKGKLYRLIYKYLFLLLGDSLWLIRVKWFVALKLVGKEFHEQNISLNREKLLKYFDARFPVQQELAERITEIQQERICLLDIGCGVISKVGNFVEDKTIEKTLFDPLANEYSLLQNKFQLPPQSKMIAGYAENLEKHFPENYFDVIYARNCIDHCYNPIKALGKMVKVLQSGGLIFMQHFVNEGERAGYFGLHQWNFNLKESDFTITNRSCSININLNVYFKDECEISSYISNEKIFCIIKKL